MNNKYIGSLVDVAIQQFENSSPKAKKLIEEQRLINSVCSQIVKIRKEKSLTQNELRNKTSINFKIKKENWMNFQQ